MTENRKVAFVTGASSGIGRATAAAFVANGYATILADRDEELGRQVEAQLRQTGECTFIRCDVTDDDAVRDAVAGALSTYGRLDAAFNAAGIAGDQGVMTADSTMENWQRVVAVNLTGLWSCMRHEIPAMLASGLASGGGSIVNCASTAGLCGVPYMSAYVAAKHGVVGLTKAAALEYIQQGIRVNAVCPGLVDTPMTQRGMTPELRVALDVDSPIGRFAQPEEIAAAVLWLSSEGASYVSGLAMPIDGGLTAR